MSGTDAMLQKLEAYIDQQIKLQAAPFRATVAGFSSGLVKITPEDATTTANQLSARLAGFPLAIGDVVLCVNRISPIVIAKIDLADDPLTNYIDVQFFNQSTADTPSTTSTSTYAVAMTGTIVLPAGTWGVSAIGGANFIHSASGPVDFYVSVNGNTGTLTQTQNLSTATYEQYVDAKSEVTGLTGTITVTVEYRAHTAGTATCVNPWAQARLRRISA
jgi:hypothetical protein